MVVSPRRVGYLTVLGVGLSLIWVLQVLQSHLGSEEFTLSAHFSDLGALMVQDPVVLNGVPVGEVRSIEWNHGIGKVTVILYQAMELPKESSLINSNFSLMGERFLILKPGHSPESLRSGATVAGIFLPGVAEALHQIDTVLTVVRSYVEWSDRTLLGSGATNGLSGLVMVNLKNLEREIQGLSHFIDQVYLMSEQNLHHFHRTAAELQQKTLQTSAHTSSILLKLNQTLSTLPSRLEEIRFQLARADRLLTHLRSPDSEFHRWALEKDLFRTLQSLTRGLNHFSSLLREDGVSGIIHFWRNIHILGTNPTRKGVRKK